MMTRGYRVRKGDEDRVVRTLSDVTGITGISAPILSRAIRQGYLCRGWWVTRVGEKDGKRPEREIIKADNRHSIIVSPEGTRYGYGNIKTASKAVGVGNDIMGCFDRLGHTVNGWHMERGSMEGTRPMTYEEAERFQRECRRELIDKYSIRGNTMPKNTESLMPEMKEGTKVGFMDWDMGPTICPGCGMVIPGSDKREETTHIRRCCEGYTLHHVAGGLLIAIPNDTGREDEGSDRGLEELDESKDGSTSYGADD